MQAGSCLGWQTDGEAVFIMVVPAFMHSCALCFILLLLNLHPSVWGEGKTMQVVVLPRIERVMWLKVGRVLPLLYTVPAGSTTSSPQSQAGASVLAAGEGRDQAWVKVRNTSSNASWACIAGSGEPTPCWAQEQLREDAVNVELPSYGHETGLSSPWERRRKWAILQTAKHYSG